MNEIQTSNANEILNNLKKAEKEKEKKKQEIFRFETDFLNKKKCTVFYFGSNPLSQKCYKCSECIRKKTLNLCQFCYEHCHSVCRTSNIINVQNKESEQKMNEEKKEQNQKFIFSEFSCECGLKLKHKPPKKPAINVVPCNMMRLDQVLEVPKFHCLTHDISICCICSVLCHKNCKIMNGKDVRDNKHKANRRCLCQTKQHTGYSELILTFPLDDYKDITEVPVWPVQILNILFANKEEFARLSELFIDTIEFHEQKIDDNFYPLLELFSNTLNRKFKAFYYDEQLLLMFDFDKIINFLFSLKTTDEKIVLVKFRIISIILFIHLKKDYDMLKTFTSIDFLSAPLMARLRYKNMLQMPCLMNNIILKKYFNKKDPIILKITLDVICELMSVGMNYLQIEENQDEFEIGLKYICFILKHILLTKNQLNTLVSSIYTFFNKFYEKLIDDRANIYLLINIFSTLAEIFMEITVTYNDLVVDEYFTENNIKSFIHKKNRDENENNICSGEMIFEMLIKCCDVLKMHYDLLLMSDIYQSNDKRLIKKQNRHKQRIENAQKNFYGTNINVRFPSNGGLLIEKIVTILEETMNMYCLADNIFKKQLNSIDRDDLEDYLLFKKQIKKGTFGNFYSVNNIDRKNRNNNKLYELKNNIENLLFDLFDNYSYQSSTDIHEKIIELLDNFIGDTNEIFQRLSTRIVNKNDKSKLKRTSSISDSNISSYKDKIIKKIKDYFPFLREESFGQDNIRNDYIDSICLYSLDETLSKLLVFFTDKRFPVILNLQLFNRIIMFFKLFLLNKRGVEYFLSGKNLTRLHKVFKRFQCLKSGKNINEKYGKNFDTNLKYVEITLYFLVELGKSIRLYKLNINRHKVLERLQRHILEHLEVLCQYQNNNINNNNARNETNYTFITKRHFYLAFKFFTTYEDDFSQENYQEIKRELLNLLLNSLNFISRDSNFVTELLKRNINLREKGSNHFSSTVFYQPSSKTFIFSQSGNITHGEEEIELEGGNNIKKVLTINSNINKEDKKENISNSEATNKKENDTAKIISNIIPIETLMNEINIKLYFALFKLINKGIFFVYKGSQEEDIYSRIISLNPIRELKMEILQNKNKGYINIKERSILLSFSRVLILLDHCDRIDLFKKDFPLNNKEYKQLIYSKVIHVKGLDEVKNPNNEPISTNIINKLKIKFNQILDLEDLIDIYIQELISFPSQCDNEDALNIFEYLKEIIYGIKAISDYFFINSDIVNKLVLKFYLLIKNFLGKSNLITSMIEDINKQSEILEEYPKIKDLEKISILQHKDVELYNIKYLYAIINDEIFQIFKKTNLNEDYDLQNYLDIFDNTNEANFTPFSLVETYDYEYFYQADSEKEEKEASKDKYKKTLIDLEKYFIEQFVDVTNTNYYNIFTNLTNDNIRLDFRRKMVDYFISFFISSESYLLTKISPLICIIDKMLFYDGEEMQPRFSRLNENKYFFSIFNSKLHELIILTIVSSKNLLNFKQSMTNILLCKLFIQFLQLLGEGFNLDYHDNLFTISKDARFYFEKQKTRTTKDDTDINNDNEDIINTNINKKVHKFKRLKTYKFEKNDLTISNETIFQLLIGSLKKCFNLVQVNSKVEGELPYDKLIVLVTNIIDFLIEFKETTEDNNSFLVGNVLDLFFGENKNMTENNFYQLLNRKGVLKESLSANISYGKKKEDEIEKEENNEEENIKKFSLRKKVICYLKIKFVDLLTNYIYLGNHPRIFEKIESKQINTFFLFKIILIHFKQLILQIKPKDNKLYQSLIQKQKDSSFVDTLIDAYKQGEIFNDIIEFPLITKLYLLIKILQELYNDKILINHLKKLKNANPKQNCPLNQEKNLTIDSYFAIRVFNFLETLILKVEIKNSTEDNDEEKENEEIIRNEDIGDVSKLIYNKIFPNFNEKEKKDKNKEKVSKQSGTNVTFFIRPSLTFRLSNESMENFENNVSRANATDKYMGLIEFSDYAIFEMIVNQHIIGNSKIAKFLSSISYKIVEYINYLLIIIQNILIMKHFYKPPESDAEFYDVKDPKAATKQFNDNFIISIIQVAFTGLMTINWFFFKFILTFQQNIMNTQEMNFVFKKKGEENIIPLKIVEYFQDKDASTFSMIGERIKEVSFFKLIIIGIFPSIILNTEINMIFFTLILSALYIKIGASLLLIIPILAIANINKILGNIFYAIFQNIRHMSLVILFILMITYIYSWFSFYFLDNFFNLEVMEYESKHLVEEPFCKSTIQCFLYITQYGLTAGGGIGEQLDMVSYKESPGIFVLRFFYDVLFFSFVILILFNIFTGIIVGAFAELRDETNQNENDKNNVCYICQLTRDDCLKQNIDFESHVKTEHFVWNYLYFLTYLHINDPNNFNSIENYVWEKLEEQDITWIPIKGDAG